MVFAMKALLRCFVLFTLSAAAVAEPLPFRRAVELAVARSGAMAVAAAEQVRARHSYLEARNRYLPQITVGSGLGASYGFPLSIEGAAPSIVSVNSQQFLFNPAHGEFLRAARTEWDATALMVQDRRSLVTLEAALTYIELDKAASTLSVLRQEEVAAARVEQIAGERFQAGVDSEVELTRARLGVARVRLRMAEAQGAADVLRLRLAQVTGLPAASIETVTESIPTLPAFSPEDDAIRKAIDSNPAVKLASEKAAAQEARARGERKQSYPAIDLAGQYALLSRSNNYDEFFNKFQRHNATFGLAVRFPVLDLAQRERAQAADAEAMKARKEADAVRDAVASEALRLQRALAQLAAAAEVTRLEHQLARADVDAARARVESGQASLREQEAARAAEHAKYAAYLDATFALQRAQLQLLRLTGELDGWALGANR